MRHDTRYDTILTHDPNLNLNPQEMAKKRGRRARASEVATPTEESQPAKTEGDDDGFTGDEDDTDLSIQGPCDDERVAADDDVDDVGDDLDDGEDLNEEDSARGDVEQPPQNKKRKRNEKSFDPLYALPTADEMLKLKNAHQGLFRENLLRMEVEEMLQEVRVPEGADSVSRSNIQKFAHGLKDILFNIPATSSTVPPVTMASLRRDRILFREPPLSTHRDVSLDFLPPKRMDLVGSYLLNAFVDRSSYMMDVSVTMPSQCFVPKDYLDGRYFYKRFLYLGALGKAIMSKAENKKVRVTWLNNDQRRPVLLVYDKNKYGETCIGPGPCVRIIPSLCPSSCPLPAPKLNPIRCNMRFEGVGGDDEDASPSEPLPTAHYNNALLGERLFHAHFKVMYSFLKESASASKAMRDAVILAKVWLKQRDFGTSKCPDSLSGFVATMIMMYLSTVSAAVAKKLGHGRMSPGNMTSLQIFRVWLDFIAHHDLTSSPIMMPSLHNEDLVLVRVTPTVEGMKAFQNAFDVVFLDSSGRFNFTADMSVSAWRELSWEAKQSLDLLQSSSTHSFAHIFLSKISFFNKYDQYVIINDEAESDNTGGESSGLPLHTLANKGAFQGKLETLLKIMNTALQGRVSSDVAGGIRLRCRPCGIWDFAGDEGPSVVNKSVVLGISLNPDTYLRVVDRGPSANDTAKAQEFSRFWGDMAQVRRFQDGAIIQSVVWEQFQKSYNRHQIIGGIAKYVVARHLSESDRVWSAMTQVLGVLDETEGYTAAALNCEGIGGCSSVTTNTC
jgi:U3 small nucleolar RNA-associated protein 22